MTSYQVVQTTADGETAILDYNLTKVDCFGRAMGEAVSWATTTCEEMPVGIATQLFRMFSGEVGTIPAAIILYVVACAALAAFAKLVTDYT